VEWDEAELKKKHYYASGKHLIASGVRQLNKKADPLAALRSLIRHDSDRIARELMRIYFS
jgi:hypothetical protein cdiviTM7_01307